MSDAVELGRIPLSECDCPKCVQLCKNRPGWFTPGQAARAAELLGMAEGEFFRDYLAVDWWEGTVGEDVFVVAPAVVGNGTGGEYPYNPRGRCVFLSDDGRCRIHAAKPLECALARHDLGRESPGHHEAIARLWDSPEGRAEVRRLLGRDPIVPEPESLLDAISGFL